MMHGAFCTVAGLVARALCGLKFLRASADVEIGTWRVRVGRCSHASLARSPRGYRQVVPSTLFLEQFRMRPCTHENDCVAIKPVDQQEITADVALAVIRPVALERVIQPLGPQRSIVANEQQHCSLQAIQVVPARAGEAVPVLDESLGEIAPPGWHCPLTAGGLFGGHRSARRQSQNRWLAPSSSRGLLPSPHESGRWAP